MINSLRKLLEMMQANGARRFYAKPLSSNDNSKNQIYLGDGFGALNVIPHGAITTDKTARAESMRHRDKADLNFFWIDEHGLSLAPRAQLILYPDYPEVRMSGFLLGAGRAPLDIMRSREEGRILVLGICDEGRILGFAAGPAHPVTSSLDATAVCDRTGVFLDLTPLLAGAMSSRDTLISSLASIHRKGWIRSRKIGRSGLPEAYSAPNGGGYTLEAELGISPNSYSEPDFLGWEVKQYGVVEFASCRPKNPITLMTPEPTGGIYRDEGLGAFLREFGYVDKNNRANRINFGGVYRAGSGFHADTGLALRLFGFDSSSVRITDLDGGLALVDVNDRIAASWGMRGLMDHWNRKHAKAVYVPSMARKPPPEYHFGYRLRICEETDFLLFLSAISDGSIYYDPGIKMEVQEGRILMKRRSQFRVTHANIGDLYQRAEDVNCD